MEVPLVRILLAIIENIFLQATHQQPYSPPPESSQPLTPLASESGAKRRRRRRRKQKVLDGGEVVSIQKNGVKKSPFPILLLCSATKRRITGLYNDLSQIVRAKKYDIGKAHEFINCLIDARNELLHKSEMVQRSCRIKKALLSNPCRRANSYDRLCEQVHKLEAEHERLKKDADIYNYIQEQLQMSPSYKMLMELNAVMEKEACEHALAPEATEISFEELLAQEKSDVAFWQRHKKLSSISSK